MLDLVGELDAAVLSVRVSLEPSPGSISLVSALQSGEGDVGIAQADVVYLAYRRGVEESQYPHTNLRGISVLWFNTVQILVRNDSALGRIEDLRGKRIGVAPIGSAGELFTRLVLNAYGMDYSDVRPEFLSSGERKAQLLEHRTLDAVIVMSSVVVGSWSVESPTGVRLLPIGGDMTERLRSQYPFIKPLVVPAHELPHQSEDVETIGTDALLICRKDLPEQLVYQLTSAFFSALPRVVGAFALAALVDSDRAPTTPIPLHPGAARYYREQEILR